MASRRPKVAYELYSPVRFGIAMNVSKETPVVWFRERLYPTRHVDRLGKSSPNNDLQAMARSPEVGWPPDYRRGVVQHQCKNFCKNFRLTLLEIRSKSKA